MIKVLVLLIISFLSSLVLANEQRCQSNRYHKMMGALNLSEDSFSNVNYEDKCNAEYFCVKATLQKPLKYRAYMLPLGSEMRICDYKNSEREIYGIKLPENKIFEVHDKLFCFASFSFDMKGNFCQCTLAKEYTYRGHTFPAGSIITVNEDQSVRNISVLKSFESGGKLLEPGNYNLHPLTNEIRAVKGDSGAYTSCGRYD